MSFENESLSSLLKMLRFQSTEIRRLAAENSELKKKLAVYETTQNHHDTVNEDSRYESTNPMEITPEMAGFFFSVFRGRADVYSRRVERKDGRAAYYPVCVNFWKDGVCPRRSGNSDIKCATCAGREWQGITKRAIMRHLSAGSQEKTEVLGIYPLLEGSMCHLLVFDFDDHSETSTIEWKSEVDTLRTVCRENNVPTLVERSRSGKGAHVWMFFEEAIPAALARQFGTALLTKGAESVNQKGFTSYDRMLPAQDSLPEGKLGNLIALPLQGEALQRGNSAFVDESWNPYPDQWLILRNIRRLSRRFIEEKIAEWTPHGLLGELSMLAAENDEEEKPWIVLKKTFSKEDVNHSVILTRSDMLWIRKEGLTPRFLNSLRRMAAFSNPEFYRQQAMGFSTWSTPRIIACHDETNSYIGIPRGKYEYLIELLSRSGIPYEENDARETGQTLNVSFEGQLYPIQQTAVEKMLAWDNGILSAATAFGKTAVGAFLIAKRKVNTLILVHNREIMKNWVDDLQRFLRYDGNPITPVPGRRRRKNHFVGCLYAGHDSMNGLMDVAMISSLSEADERLKKYGMVIMDECHHAAAATYEKVLRRINSRYLYGLTATPKRDDGQEQKILMLFGPVRYRFTAKQRAEMQNVNHYVYPRFTRLINLGNTWKIQEAYRAAIQNEDRNNLIAQDVIEAVRKGRTPLVLTRFREHAETLQRLLHGEAQHIIVLYGGRSTKERNTLRVNLRTISPEETVILIATGQYIGEGFNYPRLDTLFLATPISWEGNVEQYAGRLHRDYNGKADVMIYDYIDIHIRLFEVMYHKRLRTYKKMGYSLVNMSTEPTPQKKTIYSAEEYEIYLEHDILNARKDLIISAPRITSARLQWLLSLIHTVQSRGVSVSVITLDPESYTAERRHHAEQNITQMKHRGIRTYTMQQLHERFIILDNSIVWYGDINPLTPTKKEELIMRLNTPQLAQELTFHLQNQISPMHIQDLLPFH